MSIRTKQLCSLLVMQMGCVAVGLWMQHRFVSKSVMRTAQDEAWPRMEDAANDLLSSAAGLLTADVMTGGGGFDQAAAWHRANNPGTGDILVADLRWRVVHSVGDDGADVPPPVPGDRLTWIPAQATSGRTSASLRGTLEMHDGRHLAVARLLPDRQAYVVIHLPLAHVEAAATALFGPLPMISMMTLVWTCALMSVAAYMILARFHDTADRTRKRSAADMLRQAQSLIRTRDAVIFGLAKLADSRDPETGDHLERISVYCTTLASALQRHPEFSSEVTPALVRLIGISSALHDIGKVGIEDRILLKRGPLTEAERRRMQSHTTVGEDCLRKIERRLGSSNFLQMAREIAVAHHEWWDGNGYPNGLSGEAIPLPARIVAVADVYDALSSKRVYKRAYNHEKCTEIIRSQAGKQFDPRLVEVWMTVEQKFHDIARQYGSTAPESLPSSADYAIPEDELEADAAEQPEAVQSVGSER